MSAHPTMHDCPSFSFLAPTTGAAAQPVPASSSPPGPVRLGTGPASVPSPRDLHLKHVVPRNTKRSFTPSSSTVFPSTRHEMASISTHGPWRTTSSRSGRPIGVGAGGGAGHSSGSSSSSTHSALMASSASLAASSARHSGVFPPGYPLCPVHVRTSSPSPISRTLTRTTGLTSRLRNFNPGISSWNKVESPGTRFISAPMGSSIPTY
mmetsp:Transcript_9707/g.42330  ORF Transcript_9707/g.42330 Transcript_9707/m.42330 type:complete len:208 (+) Transcript_9707:280-903(+)